MLKERYTQKEKNKRHNREGRAQKAGFLMDYLVWNVFFPACETLRFSILVFLEECMNIKFSHDYEKLPENWDGTQAILIGVQYIDDMERFKNRLPQLIALDTKFRDEEGSYPLTFKEGILLTFFHLNSKRFFSTITQYTEEKIVYYIQEQMEIFTLKRVNR